MLFRSHQVNNLGSWILVCRFKLYIKLIVNNVFPGQASKVQVYVTYLSASIKSLLMLLLHCNMADNHKNVCPTKQPIDIHVGFCPFCTTIQIMDTILAWIMLLEMPKKCLMMTFSNVKIETGLGNCLMSLLVQMHSLTKIKI